MREIDLTSEREISELVTDTVQSAALVALASLEATAKTGARYGWGAEIESEAARGSEAVRDAAADLVDTLAATGERWGVEHDGCESFAFDCGQAVTVLAATLARITDETERGWLYGDGLVRTLDKVTEAARELADSVTTERRATPNDMQGIPLYLANVPVELAGMVAL